MPRPDRLASTGTAHVTAVVLNYQREQMTAQCVAALERSTYPVHILIVDNASPDGSGERLRTRFPQHGYLETGANLGYAGGNVRGVARAADDGADYILVLNDDAEVGRETVAQLVAAMEGEPEAGVAAPTIVYDDAAESLCWAGGGFDRLRAMGTAAHPRAAEILHRTADTPQSVTFVSGCCLMLRASAVAVQGSFRSEYFAYVEDVELSVRYARAGWTLLWVPHARVVHHTPFPEPPIAPWKIIRRDQNRRRLVATHYDTAERMQFALWYYPTRVALLAQYALRRDWDRAKAVWVGMTGSIESSR